MTEVDNLRRLIAINKKRLAILEVTRARYGIDAPPYVIMEIDDIKAELEKLHTRLAEMKDPAPVSTGFASPPPPRVFVGRQHEIDQISSMLLADDQPSTFTAAIVGIGGVGKTTLAKVLGQRLQSQFPGGALWIDMGPDARLGQIRWHLAMQLGLDIDAPPPADAVLRERLRRQGRLLIILDDVCKAEIGRDGLANLIPEDRLALLTTRQPGVALELCHHCHIHHLGALPTPTCIELLSTLLNTIADHRKEAEELAEELYGLPLALELAARLCVVGASDLPRLVSRLREANSPLELVKLSDDERREYNLKACLNLSYEFLNDEDKRRFRALGAFAPAPFDLPALAKVWGDRSHADVEDHARTLLYHGLLEQIDLLTSRTSEVPRNPIFKQHYLLWDLARTIASRENESTKYAQRHADHYRMVAQGGAGRNSWRWSSQLTHAYKEYFATAPINELLDFTENMKRFYWGSWDLE